MNTHVFALEGFLLGCFALLVSLVAALSQRWVAPLLAYRLYLPSGLTPAAATEFVAGLAGLGQPWWRRLDGQAGVVFETSADATGVRHHLLIPEPLVPQVVSALRAAIPGAIARLDSEHSPITPSRAAELRLTSQLRPLASNDQGAVSRAVLAALQPLRSGERVVIQWAVTPTPPRQVPQVSQPSKETSGAPGLLWNLIAGTRLSREDAKSLTAKQTTPLFVAAGRIGVEAKSDVRNRTLLVRLLGALHAANAPGVHLRQRLTPSRLVARGLLARRPAGLSYSCIVSAAELTGLVGLPVGDVQLPGLDLQTSRLFMPGADIPRHGRVVAQATYPDMERPLALSVRDSLRHMHVVGPTGAGKSTLLLGMISQDMEAGRGVVVVDPKGDLVADVLERIPASRVEDVIVLDPTDDERPVGLNLLSAKDTPPDLIVEQVLATFSKLYRAFWGPRTDDVLRAALLTLVKSPGMTLCEVPLLLTDPGFRRRMVARVDDPIALGPFWSWFEGLSDGERSQVIGPVLNKLRAFVMRRQLRNVLGQAEPAFDMGEVLSGRKILLVPLSNGQLGEDAAALVGALVIARLWQVVQHRSRLHASERPATFAYVDEFQTFVRLPLPLGDVLAQARGLGLGMTLAHQHLGQVSTEMRADVLANTRSRVAFQLGAADAAIVAREMGPQVTAADLQGLSAYQILATLSVGNSVSAPVSAQTALPPKPTGNGDLARNLSRERYGRARDEVEKAMRKRHERSGANTTVGRREVSS